MENNRQIDRQIHLIPHLQLEYITTVTKKKNHIFRQHRLLMNKTPEKNIQADFIPPSKFINLWKLKTYQKKKTCFDRSQYVSYRRRLCPPTDKSCSTSSIMSKASKDASSTLDPRASVHPPDLSPLKKLI